MTALLDLTTFILGAIKGSYSQEDEDRVLSKIFNGKKNGFYIDVGAHHPFRFSNTFMFYKKGWAGINIDATPDSMKMFKKYRSRDINLEIPISNTSKKIKYYIFDEPALNSFSIKLSKHRNVNTRYKIKKIIELVPKKLSDILDEYMTSNKKIDFMSVDVEGYEYNVLVSNNWKKYRPEYLLVEILLKDGENLNSNKVYKLLTNIGYKVFRKIGRTFLFKISKK